MTLKLLLLQSEVLSETKRLTSNTYVYSLEIHKTQMFYICYICIHQIQLCKSTVRLQCSLVTRIQLHDNHNLLEGKRE